MKRQYTLSVLRRLVLVALLVATTTLVAAADVTTAQQPAPPRSGLICTTDPNATPTTATFTLNTREGYIGLPDGNVVYMWGFSAGAAGFQHPSPVLCVNEGQTVTIVVNNSLPEPISLVFPGQTDVMAGGALSQPQFDGAGALLSLTQTAAPGGSMSYVFNASRPGTFMYQSGTDPLKQVNMGLFGVIVVRPATNNPAGDACYAYNSELARYRCDEEFLMLLSEIDPMLHSAVEQRQPYDMSQFHIRYWLINGRSYPDTIDDNFASWLPDQPYSALVHIYPRDEVSNPHAALVRYAAVSIEDSAHHPHGNHQRIIAQDGFLLAGAAGEDLSYEKFTTLIGPGQTWDMLFDWRDQEGWDPVTNPIPVPIPQLQNLVIGSYYSGSPYLGNTGTLPVGMQSLNQCGEYYHIAHNHALQKITAWGMVLSGHITFTRIDPPQPNNCPE